MGAWERGFFSDQQGQQRTNQNGQVQEEKNVEIFRSWRKHDKNRGFAKGRRSHVHPERKNEGTFAKNTLLRNRPLVSSRKILFRLQPHWVGGSQSNISKMPNFIIKNGNTKDLHLKGGFRVFQSVLFFSSLLFSALVLLFSLCFSYILKPKNYPPNEVTKL